MPSLSDALLLECTERLIENAVRKHVVSPFMTYATCNWPTHGLLVSICHSRFLYLMLVLLLLRMVFVFLADELISLTIRYHAREREREEDRQEARVQRDHDRQHNILTMQLAVASAQQATATSVRGICVSAAAAAKKDEGYETDPLRRHMAQFEDDELDSE
ncbi:hypothetical protein SEUCBS139899_002001 [Sporothrix eucalyptigena]|uniref:Uncharacterized protein n=1 Tax=Sporothrix eucalyptigena TaxID=1812306 RepID=A0ABP0CBW3_9PEZI